MNRFHTGSGATNGAIALHWKLVIGMAAAVLLVGVGWTASRTLYDQNYAQARAEIDDLEARYLFLDQKVKLDPTQADTALLVEPQLGACLRAHLRAPVLGAQVGHQALLAAVPHQEATAVLRAEAIALRRLDLHDSGAIVRQHHAGERGADAARPHLDHL